MASNEINMPVDSHEVIADLQAQIGEQAKEMAVLRAQVRQALRNQQVLPFRQPSEDGSAGAREPRSPQPSAPSGGAALPITGVPSSSASTAAS